FVVSYCLSSSSQTMKSLLATIGNPQERILALLKWNQPSDQARLSFLRTLALGEQFDDKACAVLLEKLSKAARDLPDTGATTAAATSPSAADKKDGKEAK